MWVLSGPASRSEITVIDPARSNTVLDQFCLPPTAPALCICAVPPIGQCQYNGLQQTTYLMYSVLVISSCTKLITAHFLPFLVLLCQVTLQEQCGSELRKEGSGRWINMLSSMKTTLSATRVLAKHSNLFVPPPPPPCPFLTV